MKMKNYLKNYNQIIRIEESNQSVLIPQKNRNHQYQKMINNYKISKIKVKILIFLQKMKKEKKNMLQNVKMHMQIKTKINKNRIYKPSKETNNYNNEPEM